MMIEVPPEVTLDVLIDVVREVGLDICGGALDERDHHYRQRRGMDQRQLADA
jgi:hypothetical protein